MHQKVPLFKTKTHNPSLSSLAPVEPWPWEVFSLPSSHGPSAEEPQPQEPQTFALGNFGEFGWGVT